MPADCDPAIREELYLASLLLRADAVLLSTLRSWGAGLDDKEVLTELRNWNEAKLLELKEWLPSMSETDLEVVQEQIRQYESVRASERGQAQAA
jgi:hypothetical protein